MQYEAVMAEYLVRNRRSRALLNDALAFRVMPCAVRLPFLLALMMALLLTFCPVAMAHGGSDHGSHHQTERTSGQDTDSAMRQRSADDGPSRLLSVSVALASVVAVGSTAIVLRRL